jgi:hypothetical protein
MNQTNTILLERAAELIDELMSHPSKSDEQLIEAINANDLDEVRRLVTKLEAELSEEHFRNYNLAVQQ